MPFSPDNETTSNPNLRQLSIAKSFLAKLTLESKQLHIHQGYMQTWKSQAFVDVYGLG